MSEQTQHRESEISLIQFIGVFHFAWNIKLQPPGKSMFWMNDFAEVAQYRKYEKT